jgi:hypothetical protein
VRNRSSHNISTQNVLLRQAPELSGLFHGIEAALGFQHGDPVRARLVEKLTQFRSLSEKAIFRPRGYH